MAILDTFKDLVGATAGKTDAVLTRFLGYAAARLGTTASTEWGDSYEQAICYLAGHMLVRASAGAGGAVVGGVTSESAGGMSRGYGGVAGMADADLLTTAPGADFVALRKATICTVLAFLPDETYALR